MIKPYQDAFGKGFNILALGRIVFGGLVPVYIQSLRILDADAKGLVQTFHHMLG
jgi:hypothetical protein